MEPQRLVAFVLPACRGRQRLLTGAVLVWSPEAELHLAGKAIEALLKMTWVFFFFFSSCVFFSDILRSSRATRAATFVFKIIAVCKYNSFSFDAFETLHFISKIKM